VQAETLLVLFVGVTAASLLLQGVFLVRLMASARRMSDRISTISRNLNRDTQQVVSQLQEVAASLDHLRRISENIGDRASEINLMFEERSKDVDQLVAKLAEVGDRQAANVDEVVSDTVEKFQQTTAIIQEDILRPVVEISSTLKGLRAGLGYLFARKSPQADQNDADEDLFI
jgi:methyl-accepting chemotaxis protein